MPREKTKGPPIQFRLSIQAHEELVLRAQRRGLSVREYLVEQLEKSLQLKEGS